MIKNDIIKLSLDDLNTKTIETLLIKITRIEMLHYYIIIRKFEFNMIYINKLRYSIVWKVKEFINLNNQYKQDGGKNTKVKRRSSSFGEDEYNVECNLKWPICIFDNDFKYSITECMSLSSNMKTVIIDNYFFERVDKLKKKLSVDNIIFEFNKSNAQFILDEENILIERRIHKCYILKDNIELSFDKIPEYYMNDIFEDQDFKDNNDCSSDNIEAIEKKKLLKRQGMKCNYLKLNQGGSTHLILIYYRKYNQWIDKEQIIKY